MIKKLYKKYCVITVFFLFLGVVFFPSISGNIEKISSIYNENELNRIKTKKELPINYPDSVWKEQAKLLAWDGENNDWFGSSVSIDGDYAFIGAPNDDNGDGSVYVFERDDSTWIEVNKLTTNDMNCFFFGFSVCLDGDYALIGAPYDDGSKGSVYVFKLDGSNWKQEDKLTALDGEGGDYFGGYVSLDGDYALIGTPGDDDRKGSAYVFKCDGSSWVQEDKLTALDGEPLDYFGTSVSLDGDYALIGAPFANYLRGSVFVFKRDGSSWIQVDKLSALDANAWDEFGMSIYLDGDHLLIGASGDDDYTGSTYEFKRDGSTWIQENKLIALDGLVGDYFGCSVSLDGDYALIGANALWIDEHKGSAYVFKRDGLTWIQEDKLIASDVEGTDYYGDSVSLDGDYAFIGAPRDDEQKGSVYVFKHIYPDLDCDGDIHWTDVDPGETKIDSFTIENIGDESSKLDWEITDWPNWGNWTFQPISGEDLTPDGKVTVHVSVIITPYEPNKEFFGNITVVNRRDISDFENISVYLRTPRNKAFNVDFSLFSWLFERFPKLFLKLIQLF